MELKIVVTHKLNLELLKRIQDIDYVVSIKVAPYSAGASSDFDRAIPNDSFYAPF